MRGLLQRNKKARHSGAAPSVPKALQSRVDQRLQQITSAQEQQLANNWTDDSEDSENSLLQANQRLPCEDVQDEDDGDILRPWSTTAGSNSLMDESSRLLQTIGSDLSDAPYFEEDSSSSYNASERVQETFLAPLGVLPRSLLGSDRPALFFSDDDVVDSTSPLRVGYTDSREHAVPRSVPQAVVVDTTVPTTFFYSSAAKRLAAASLSATLAACCLYQLYYFPAVWLAWLSSVLSLYCSTLLWPSSRAPWPSEAALRERRQSLVALGLPYKSRLLVAQAQVKRLQERIVKLQELQAMQDAHLQAKQQAALEITVQVLLKSNRTPNTTHLNALTLSVLPVKLAAVDVQVHMPVLFALAQSRTGSRAILCTLFRELMAGTDSTIFRYPPLVVSPKRTVKTTKTPKGGGLRKVLKRRSPRTESI